MADLTEKTTGHEWDGIEERDTPLPRWWLWTFYATVVFSIAYCVAYPSIPFLNSASKGVLGWSSRDALAREQAAVKRSRAGIEHQLASLDVEQIAANPALMRTAVEGGRAAYKVNCVQCHGSGAAGSPGYPNLNDNEWLWGGDMKAIRATLEHGIRQPGDDATRMSQMPAFGRDGILKPGEVEDVVSYVRFVGKQERDSASARRGAALYETNCVACHGTDLKGNRGLGAPNLADAIWLYGGDRQSIANTVTNARYGVMPAWNKKLGPATLNMLTAYVHSLGGGE